MNNSFTDYVKAGTPLIAVRSFEEVRVLEALEAECKTEELIYQSWDVVTGGNFDTNDPVEFLAQVAKLEIAEDGTSNVDCIFMLDIHNMLSGPEAIRAMKLALEHIKNIPVSLVMISPEFKLPVELSKDGIQFEFILPTVLELKECALSILKANELETETLEKDGNAVFTAARGLTMPEAINAFGLSLIKYGHLDKKLILHEKLQAVRKSGLMEIYEAEPEDKVGGMKELKAYMHARKIGFTDPKYPKPTGMLMVGPPGAGKSLAAKMIANILDVPLLRLDFSNMKSKYVGDSEARVKQVLQLIDSVSPCVVWMDRFCSSKIV